MVVLKDAQKPEVLKLTYYVDIVLLFWAKHANMVMATHNLAIANR